MSALYTCPVCGFPELEDAPENYEICPCCGTEFWNDDFDTPHAELRDRWIASGMQWWSPYDVPPENWDPKAQVMALLGVETPEWTQEDEAFAAELR